MDEGPPTPIAGSGAYPALQAAALELADELFVVPDEECRRACNQLRAIAALMASWTPRNRPTEPDRRRLVDELVETTKRAHSLLGRTATRR